jgi:hypothetical protein
MTQQEFSDRTGFEVSAEEFAKIHKIYMSTSFEKDDFCREWKAVGESALVQNLCVVVEMKERALDQAYKHEEALVAKQVKSDHDIAAVLLRAASEHYDNDLAMKAVELVGRRSAILIKAQNGIDLTSEEVQYLFENLK